VQAFVNNDLLTLKIITPTLIFYSIAAAMIALLEWLFPSGPCTPGLGVLSFFLLIPVSVGLLIRNVILTFTDRKYFTAVLLHLIVVFLLFALMW
jgi:ACR3 family arsenite efflux pump ArsB